MGCQNGKSIAASTQHKTEQLKQLIEKFDLLQKNIVTANLQFQIKTNQNKQKIFEKQNFQLSIQTNDNSINEDLNIAFIKQMRSFQTSAKDLLTKASYLLEQYADQLSQSLRTQLKEKVDCLYEFAFILQLDTATRPSSEEIQNLGDLCESVIIA